MTKELSRSYSVSITTSFKDKYCQAFNGSITKTFKFLCELMESACIEGKIDNDHVAAIMSKHRPKGIVKPESEAEE